MFVLAVVVGYYVIGKVHHALHTPLMSVTNAISGIIVVGALSQIGRDDTVIRVLAFVAILLASINIFGGFAVTRRMLGDVLEGLRRVSATSIADAAYIVAALLFIMSLAGLSHHESAKQGVVYGIAGMAIALAATIGVATRHIAAVGLVLLVVAVVVGAAVGLWRARVVEMTGMPELIALLHSFVGLAAVLVGWNGYYDVEGRTAGRREFSGSLLRIHHAEVFIGVFIGAVTFTGSLVAYRQAVGADQARRRSSCRARTRSTSACSRRSPG